MKISTKFWEKEDAKHYREQIIKLTWLWILFIVMNMGHYAMNSNYAMATINGIFFSFAILIIQSHKKYNKKAKENEKVQKMRKGTEERKI